MRETPLIAAALHGCNEVMDVLLEHGASTSEFDVFGNTALIYAARLNYLYCVRRLIDHGSSINWPNSEWNTAIVEAAYNGHTNIVQFLIEHGADIHFISNLSNMSALTCACLKVTAHLLFLLSLFFFFNSKVWKKN